MNIHKIITVLFIGNLYWVYDGYQFINSPQYITNYGLSLDVPKVDAVFVWGK